MMGTRLTHRLRHLRMVGFLGGQPGTGRSSMLSAASFVVPAASLALFTPLLVRELGAREYGLWILSTSFLGLMGVLDLGLSTALAKFVAEYRALGDSDQFSEVVSLGVGLYVLVGLLLTPLIFILAPVMANALGNGYGGEVEATSVIRIVSLGLVAVLLKNAALAVPIGMNRFGPPAAVSVFQTFSTLGLATIAGYFTDDVRIVVASTVASIWLTATLSSAWSLKLYRASGGTARRSLRQLRVLGRYVMFSSVTAIGHMLFSSLDRVIVGVVLGSTALAYYSVSIGVAVNMLSVADALTRPLMPSSSALSSIGAEQRLHDVLARATLAVTALEAAGAGLLIWLAPDLLRIWLGADFASHTVTAFRILVAIFAVTAIGAPAFHIANGIGLPWLGAAGGLVGGALTLVLIVVLGPHWGVVGAAVANVGAFLALLPLLYMIGRLARPRSKALYRP